MHDTSTYELLDFGNGRKRERISGAIVDRPCPAADHQARHQPNWSQADLLFDGNRNRWTIRQEWRQQTQTNETTSQTPWCCDIQGIRLLLKPTPAGHLGIFPEHWSHWDWLFEQIDAPESEEKTITSADAGIGVADTASSRVLHLFAYTGASTLALARRGCQVTHVDASKPTVAWARENAVASGLQDAPVRWIVDDARDFVRKELRRQKRYELILLDPPSFGHGPAGTRWEIHRDLLTLLLDCWKLLSDRPRGVLLTGHSTHIALREYHQQIARIFGNALAGECEISQARLVDSAQRRLDCGFVAKFSFPRY